MKYHLTEKWIKDEKRFTDEVFDNPDNYNDCMEWMKERHPNHEQFRITYLVEPECPRGSSDEKRNQIMKKETYD